MLNFGSGALFGARTDIANSTPIEFGILQDVSLDWSFAKKELRGTYQYAQALGRGAATLTGKAKFARIGGLAFSSLAIGGVMTSGQVKTAYHEAASVPGATTYTIQSAQHSTFAVDLGVTYANGTAFQKVASGSEAAGKYSVNAATGVYTFAAADASAAVLLNYTYTVAGSGQLITLANPLMGAAPTFRANLYGTFGGNEIDLQLNACVTDKLSMATKLDDWTIPEFDFSVIADSVNNILTLGISDL